MKHIAQLMRGKRWEEAELYCRRLIELRQHSFVTLNQLVKILIKLDKFDDCVALLQQSLAIEPMQPDALMNLGMLLRQQDRLQEAAKAWAEAIHLAPNRPDLANNLGALFLELNQPEHAIDCLRDALSLCRSYPAAWNNLGNAYKQIGSLDLAAEAYRHALNTQADFPEAFNNLGSVLQQKGNLEDAADCYEKALQIKPDFADAHLNLGTLLQESGRLEEALLAYQMALKLNPADPCVLNNLGVLHQLRDEFEEAARSFEAALQADPYYKTALLNHGVSCNELGRHSDAISSYQRILALSPDDADVQNNMAHVLLAQGIYHDGWRLYEARFRVSEKRCLPHVIPSCPVWDGSPLKAAHTLLLVSEQGLGDTLQFVRYVRHLRQLGLPISLCVQNKLHGLMISSDLDLAPYSHLEGKDWSNGVWLPLLSLPRYLGVGYLNALETEPYLRVSAERVERWRERLAGEKRPLVGINWQGNPRHEQGTSRGRSLPLEAFAPLASVLGGGLISLQKGAGSEQLADCSFRDRFVSCQAEIDQAWDFEETAAVLANCDLIISSDTSIVHLAGGMGLKTWLLLKKVPEWRWGLEGEDTFWYPSMRLFRQRERGDWAELMQRVAAAIRDELVAVI